VQAGKHGHEGGKRIASQENTDWADMLRRPSGGSQQDYEQYEKHHLHQPPRQSAAIHPLT
jgi:hypothetical protein